MINFDNVIWYGIVNHFKGHFHCCIDLLQCNTLFLECHINETCVWNWHPICQALCLGLKDVSHCSIQIFRTWHCTLAICCQTMIAANIGFISDGYHWISHLYVCWATGGLNGAEIDHGLSSWISNYILSIVAGWCDRYTMKLNVVLGTTLNHNMAD